MKIWILGLLCVACTGGLTLQAEQPPFSTVVRPVLSNHCYACHGPDEESREADVRLDVAGQVDLDTVLERIRSDDPDVVMPPPSTNKPLSAEDAAMLEQWIAAGAEYEQHWAFLPPETSDVPAGAHPIDHFIDQRLKTEGLTRSPVAEPATRLRRVSLDLIGLPPTIQQVRAFEADPSDEAFAAFVDELLASPRYGERWARRWLDLARYADTNGYEKDKDRSIWPYRDWVIRAINDGMPFDQFTIEQIAGDMLPDATSDQLTATGFHRNTMLNEEGGVDPLEFRFHAMTDRVATTGTTWLGLTTGCAQCHTHKYDPITHHDYFGLMAYLNNTDEPKHFVRTLESVAAYERGIERANQIIADLPSHWTDETTTFEQAFDAWWAVEQTRLIDWQTIVPKAMRANVPYLTLEDDGAVFVAGDFSKHDVVTLEFDATSQAITSIRLGALPDERLPGGGPGMTYYEGTLGDFYLTEFVVQVEGEASPIKISDASETFQNNRFGSNPVSAKLTTDGDLQTGWSINGRSGQRHVAVYALESPIPAGKAFTIRMDFGRHYASTLGKFRLSVTNQAEPAVASLLDVTSDDLAVREAFLMQSPPMKAVAEKVIALRQADPGTPTLVMRERPQDATRPTFLHHRGEYTQAREQVPPRVPEVLMDAQQTPPQDRLEFARWLVARDNPLTARVVVNRHWAALFGTGLVSTVDDFGMQGELPSHPKLLDHLAVQFMQQGWSIKQLHRWIVTSHTYNQSSQVTDSNLHDLGTRLLQRYPRRRLEAEIIRDASLAASGLLNTTMYGPPVRPPQPAAARAANYSKSTWKASEGADRYRRSVYTYQKRTAPFAMFTTFDATSGEACVAKRDVSNTPLQALTLMNDPMFLEISEAYGKRMAATDGDVSEKIKTGFRWLLSRRPTAEELDLLTKFQARHNDWTATARALLCLDESINQN